MAFKSRRLRVQIPCRVAESKVEIDAGRLKGLTETFCRLPSEVDPCYKFHTPPVTCYRFRTCLGLHSAPCLGQFSRPEVCMYPTLRPNCELEGSVWRCPGGSEVCPGGSELVEEPTWTIDVIFDPDHEDTVLLRPEHLPQLRQQLESHLQQIDALVERRDEIEGQLKEVRSVEEQIEKSSKG